MPDDLDVRNLEMATAATDIEDLILICGNLIALRGIIGEAFSAIASIRAEPKHVGY